jgi:hypothetical protein
VQSGRVSIISGVRQHISRHRLNLSATSDQQSRYQHVCATCRHVTSVVLLGLPINLGNLKTCPRAQQLFGIKESRSALVQARRTSPDSGCPVKIEERLTILTWLAAAGCVIASNQKIELVPLPQGAVSVLLG